MRIVAGIHGGRTIKTPKGKDIRPTSDKTRGAMFNSLTAMGALDGAVVIDAFCGTGALGLEALSRGASQCLFVDKHRASVELAKENADILGEDAHSKFMLKDASKLPPRLDDYDQASLIFLDPPYYKDLIIPTLKTLKEGDWLQKAAIVVLETEKNFEWLGLEGFIQANEKIYGETKVISLRTPE